jgi:hypothetical protein
LNSERLSADEIEVENEWGSRHEMDPATLVDFLYLLGLVGVLKIDNFLCWEAGSFSTFEDVFDTEGSTFAVKIWTLPNNIDAPNYEQPSS